MIKPAQIQWTDGTPVSTQFEDIYFHKGNGLEETEYVFLHHNKLKERWSDATNMTDKNHFTIAETGFGTGLNFLSAWDLWLQNSKPEQTLHFLSVEKFPLEKQSLQKALEQWPQLNTLGAQLIEMYPKLVPGWHSIHFNNSANEKSGSVVLHLFFGDVHDWLNQVNAQVDAWFLDGFAPDKNPDMWNAHLFTQMARLTPAFGTVATFTASGLVKRGLKAAGFEIKKVKGFGHKRDMLTAKQMHCNGPVAPLWIKQKPWFIHPTLKHQYSNQRHAVVIGAGIAGCSTAHSLAKRGWRVSLLDERDELANGASGNAQGVLYAKLSSAMNLHSQFYLAGYLYSLQSLNNTLPSKQNWNDCGVLQLAFSEKEVNRQKDFCERFELDEVVSSVTSEQASKLAGIEIKQPGLHFHNGAWVYPRSWCETLIEHKHITFLPKHQVNHFEQRDDKQWTVKTHQQTFSADAVIVCNASQAKSFKDLNFLPTKSIAGQVTQLSLTDKHTPESFVLNKVLCGESYVSPSHKGKINFGASYRLGCDSEEVLAEEHKSNLKKLSEHFPGVSNQIQSLAFDTQAPNGRASVRCTSPDYTPIVGPVCKHAEFLTDFSELKKSKKWRFFREAQFHEGLYVNLAHGSRGLSSAPLCAELIAAMLNQEPWPLPQEQANLLSPNRFLVKEALVKT